MKELKFIVFKVGKESYGIDIGVVQGIENTTDIVKTPNSPDYIKGIINLRGEVIPIYNLRTKFGLEDIMSSENTKFIIIKTDECKFAIEVDQVENIQIVEDDKIYDTPIIIKSSNTDYVEKVINIDGFLVVLINPVYLLNNEDKEKLITMINEAI